MENSFLTLVPPLLAILMAILTRRVLLSLGTGIVASALLIEKGQPGATAGKLWEGAKGLFVEDSGLNNWNIYIISFLLILGMVTALANIAGGSRAFGEWAMTKVKGRAGAQVLAAVMGIVIFIDDYFNALAVGQVSRPVTDRYKVSRAKLAYIIDSTSAPVCVIAPISSWGAYIIGLVGSVLAAHQVTNLSAFTAFIKMIPMNLYVWASLALVFIFALTKAEFGPMKKHEERAMETGMTFDPEKEIPGEVKDEVPVSDKGTIGDLVWPLAALFAGTLGGIFLSGWRETAGSASMMEIFGNADVSEALIYGGIAGLAVTVGLFVKQMVKHRSLTAGHLFLGLKIGIKSMLPAIMILLFAWMLSGMIEDLGTGAYLASLVENSELSTSLLLPILFIGAGVIAFSTGTSWGSFGILLPIAGQIMAVADISLLLPAMAAVLAGAVFGDHCSPISDTTILSSTGASSNHIDHVTTQLPYAFLAAGMSAIGYLVVGLTDKPVYGLITVAILLIIFAVFAQKTRTFKPELSSGTTAGKAQG